MAKAKPAPAAGPVAGSSQADELVAAARAFVRTAAPGLRETTKYGIPFFVARRNAVYVSAQRDGVFLGFADGAQMVEFHGVFDEVLGQVAKVRLRTQADLRRKGLREAVRAAAEMAA